MKRGDRLNFGERTFWFTGNDGCLWYLESYAATPGDRAQKEFVVAYVISEVPVG